MPRYALEQLAVPNDAVTAPDPTGAVMNADRVPGATIAHWMDVELARAWFARAKDLSQQLSAVPPTVSTYDVLYALMQGYNALNIPWYIDPIARGYWRAYMAGGPAYLGTLPNGGASPLEALYGRGNYNPAWFTGDSEFPGYSQGMVTQQVLGLARRTPELAAGEASRALLTHTAWPWIDVPPELQSTIVAPGEVGPEYQPVVQNVAVTGGFVDAAKIRAPPIFTALPLVSVIPAPTGVFRSVDHPDGPNLDITGLDGAPRASDFSFDANFIGRNVIGAPEGYYAGWIHDWARDMVARDPRRVAVEARIFAAYTNAMMASRWTGGPAQFVSDATSLPADVVTQRLAGGDTATGLRVGAATAGAIGAALAPATFGISGVIGGAVALGLSLGASAVRGRPRTTGRDDLGRYKPVIERGWLAGNPTIADLSGVPTLNVPDPPGFVRPAPPPMTIGFDFGSFVHDVNNPPAPTGGLNDTSTPGTTPGNASQVSPWLWALGAVGAAGIVYVATRPAAPAVAAKTTRKRSKRL